MEQVPGIWGSNIADLVGRKRQNVQVLFEWLEELGFVLKYPASYRDQTVGWGLTEQGHTLSPGLIHDLQVLIRRLKVHPPMLGGPGLIEIAKEPKVPLWDV